MVSKYFLTTAVLSMALFAGSGTNLYAAGGGHGGGGGGHGGGFGGGHGGYGGGYGHGGYGYGGGYGRGFGYGGYGYGGFGYGLGLGYGLGYYGLGYGGFYGAPYYGGYGYGYPSYYSPYLYPTYGYGGIVSNGAPSGSQSVASNSYYYPQSSNSYYYPPIAANSPTPATLRVTLPDPQATVIFDGYKTTSTGSERYFHTPDLTPGGTYQYHLQVSWMQDGQKMTQEKTVQVTPGQTTDVVFDRTAEPTRAISAAK